jgi:hypothetical protein
MPPRTLNGSFDQIKIGLAQYLARWRDGIYADYIDTKAVQAFLDKPFAEAVQWVPSRMIDEVVDMIAAYRKNQNGPQGNTTLFPVVLLAIDDNLPQVGVDWGGQQIGRRLLQIEEGGSWYGYRHSMVERRAQVVIVASEGGSAQSLAAQLAGFVFEPKNRCFDAHYTFGEYIVPSPVELESNRLDFMEFKVEGKNIKVLFADMTLKCTIPWFDAPRPGEENDGSGRNPPGFPATQSVSHLDNSSGTGSTTTNSGITWGTPE